MILPIVKYGHPVLRQRGKRIDSITPEIQELAGSMVETMASASGVGLAAQQVGFAIQLMVLDVRDTERSSSIQIAGVEADIDSVMPMVLINPVITDPVGEQIGVEGCLSFPSISSDVPRAETITVTGLDVNGQKLHFRCSGLLARAIQHEADHLNGVLFIDRMDSATKVGLAGQLKRLQKETQAELKPPAKRGVRALLSRRRSAQ